MLDGGERVASRAWKHPCTALGVRRLAGARHGTELEACSRGPCGGAVSAEALGRCGIGGTAG